MNSVKVEVIEMEDSTDTCEVVTIDLNDRVIVYTIAYGKIISYKEDAKDSSSINKQ